jgi:hypothetical protein
MKLPGHRGDYAWPKLEAAYEYCFNKPYVGGHHADSDVQATKDIYIWLSEMNELL